MSNSKRTAEFGPRVSYSTTKSDNRPVHVLFPSGGTVEFADVAAAKFSNVTTASPTSTFIPDGFFSIVSHSANSMVLAIRSGASTYVWTNDAGGVL